MNKDQKYSGILIDEFLYKEVFGIMIIFFDLVKVKYMEQKFDIMKFCYIEYILFLDFVSFQVFCYIKVLLQWLNYSIVIVYSL